MAWLSRCAWLGLFVLAVGCGGVDTGTKSPDGNGNPTPTPTQDPDPTPTPDNDGPEILPPLTELGGLVGINRNRSTLDFVAEDNFEGGGFFLPGSAPIPAGLIDDFFDYGANWPDDTCKPGSALAFAMNGAPRDAGQMNLEGPAGDLPFIQLFGMYAAGNGDKALFVPNDTYTLTASGAQVAAFAVSVDSPGDIDVTSPALLGTDPFPVDRTVDLALKWTSTPDGTAVFAMISAGPGESYHCKFVDDGSAAIPASILQNFYPTGVLTDEDPVPELNLWKYRYTYFTPAGAAGPVLVILESGWYIEVAFQ